MTRRRPEAEAPEAGEDATPEPEAATTTTTPEAEPEELGECLRRVRPSRIIAHLADGGTKPVAVVGDRKRWDKAAKAVEQLPWTRVELLDVNGDFLEMYPPAEAEDPVVETRPEDREERLLRLVLDGQREMRAAVHEAIDGALAANERLVQLLIEREERTMKREADALDIAAQAGDAVLDARAAAVAATGADGQPADQATALAHVAIGHFLHGVGVAMGKEHAPLLVGLAQKFLAPGAPTAPATPAPDAGGE